MAAREVRRRFRGPLLELVLKMAEVWFASRTEIVFHDPLAAALVFRPDICRLEPGVVGVDDSLGRTSFQPGVGGKDLVAIDVNSALFFEEYFGVLMPHPI